MWTNRQRSAMPLRVYFSHPIRGKAGENATNEQIQENINRVWEVVNEIRQEYGPVLDIYFPGEHDLFVQKAFRRGYLTESQILAVDCEIISGCDAVFGWSWEDELSRGMQVEFDWAMQQKIPYFTVWTTDVVSIGKLEWRETEFGSMTKFIRAALDEKYLKLKGQTCQES